MGRYKTCLICHQHILPAESYVPYGYGFAHDECFNKQVKKIIEKKNVRLEKEKKKSGAKSKPQAQLKEGLSEEEYAKKKKYYNYLKDLLEDEELTAKQFAVSERYVDRYMFTFDGMYQTLVYLNEIIHKELNGDIVGIIPYYYSDAEKFYQEVEEIGKNSKKINLRELYPERAIKMKPKKREIKQLDIESIGS